MIVSLQNYTRSSDFRMCLYVIGSIDPGEDKLVGKKPFIGLPGNPVAAIVTFMIFARPALLTLAGCTDTKPLSFRVPALFSYNKKAGRKEWIRASITSGTDGQIGAKKYHKDGAGILSSMVNTSGLLELPEELTEIRAGTMLKFIPFSEMS